MKNDLEDTATRLRDELAQARETAAILGRRVAEMEACVQSTDGRESFQVLVEATSDLVKRLDENGRHLYVNPAVAKLRGLPQEAFLGRTHRELGFAPCHCDTLEKAVRQVFSSGRPMTESCTCPAEAGPRAFEWRLFPECDGEGRVISVLSVGRDVSDRRQVEEKLTAAQEQAEIANMTKSQFLAMVSHELRTPLNGVMGMLQLLDCSGLDPEQAGFVATAYGSAKNLARLIGDILDLSRLESGRLRLAESPFDPALVMEEIVKTFEAEAGRKGLALTAAPDPSLPREAIGDPARLRQVLFNLVGNAVKFTKQGKVTVSAWSMPNPDGRVTLFYAVSDTGIGFPEDMAEILLEPFTQADASLTRRHGGAGLGLAIVRRLVESMSGHITLESQLEAGTTVTFAVPVTTAVSHAKAAPGKAVALKTKGRRVLVVENEPVNRLTMVRLAESLGCRAAGVESGAEALRALRQEPVDLILMDIHMPGLNGLETLRLIRSDAGIANGSRVPVVAVTADAMPGRREAFLAAGLDGYLAKPVELAALAETLDRLLSPAGPEA